MFFGQRVSLPTPGPCSALRACARPPLPNRSRCSLREGKVSTVWPKSLSASSVPGLCSLREGFHGLADVVAATRWK